MVRSVRLLRPAKPSFSWQIVHAGYPPATELPAAAFFMFLNSGLARLMVMTRPWESKRGFLSSTPFLT